MMDLKTSRALLAASLVGGLLLTPAVTHAAATYELDATDPTDNNDQFAKGTFEFGQNDEFSDYEIDARFGLGQTVFVDFKFTPQNSSVVSTNNSINRAININAPFPSNTSDIASNRLSHFLVAENLTAVNQDGSPINFGYWALTLNFENQLQPSGSVTDLVRGSKGMQGTGMAISSASGTFTSGSNDIVADFKTGLNGTVAQGAIADAPVPASLSLLGFGLVGLSLVARRRAGI